MTGLQNNRKDQTSKLERHYWDWWQDTNSTNAWALHRSETLTSMIRPLLTKQNPKILDAGCGNGWYTRKLAEFGKVTGIDLSESHMAEAARRYPSINFIAGDFIEYDFSHNQFDLVISQQVLPHVYDQQKYINKVHDLLVSGGYLALTMNNKFVIHRMKNYKSHIDQGHKENWLSLRELGSLLKPSFRLHQIKSIIPMGDQGILSVINSRKLNSLLEKFIAPRTIERLKEFSRLGYVNLILAQKI